MFEFGIIVGLVGLSFLIPALSIAPWVPTRSADVKRFQDILEMKPGEAFLEIGSGDARVCRAIARKFPDNRVVGIEYFFILAFYAKVRNILFPHKNLELIFGDAWKHNFSQYQHIYLFGMPEVLKSKIIPKFLSEAPVGAQLYSYTFSLPVSEAYKSQTLGGEGQNKIHIITKL